MTLLHYPHETRTLANGLRVIVAPDAGAPGVSINLTYNVGSADEVAGRTGFAHLFEHLMFQGSTNAASGEHLALIEAAGGHANATTSFETTNYFETVPTGALDLALWLEADRLAGLAITQANLDNQRDVVKEEKRQSYDNQPYGDLLELLVAQHFPAHHPYGHLPIGSMADLDAAALSDVQSFFDRWYTASNVVLTLCGDLGIEQGFELAERYFGALPAAAIPTRPEAGVIAEQAEAVIDEVTRDVPHDVSYLSWRTPPLTHPDADLLELAFAVLGDGLSSRLHRRLVKNDDLAEHVGASGLELARSNSLAVITVRIDDHQSLQAAEDAIGDELRRFVAEPPTMRELDRVKAQYERDWLTSLASTSSRAEAICTAAVQYGDPDRINTHLARMQSATPDDVAGVVARYLDPDQRTVLRYRKGAHA